MNCTDAQRPANQSDWGHSGLLLTFGGGGHFETQLLSSCKTWKTGFAWCVAGKRLNWLRFAGFIMRCSTHSTKAVHCPERAKTKRCDGMGAHCCWKKSLTILLALELHGIGPAQIRYIQRHLEVGSQKGGCNFPKNYISCHPSCWKTKLLWHKKGWIWNNYSFICDFRPAHTTIRGPTKANVWVSIF